MKKIAYIGIGSNIEPRHQYCKTAIEKIRSHSKIWVTKVSSLIETKPVGVENQNDFINGVIEIETTLPPFELLSSLKIIEKDIGRKPTSRWGPREIDLDILSYNNEKIQSERLQLPHPEIRNRNYLIQLLHQLKIDLKKIDLSS